MLGVVVTDGEMLATVSSDLVRSLYTVMRSVAGNIGTDGRLFYLILLNTTMQRLHYKTITTNIDLGLGVSSLLSTGFHHITSQDPLHSLRFCKFIAIGILRLLH